jgi:hypothetical protein
VSDPLPLANITNSKPAEAELGGNLTQPRRKLTVLKELLRSALMLGVSALDRYMYERIVKKIVGALKKGKLCKEQADFAIPAEVAIRVANRVVVARRKGQAVRPTNEIRIVIQDLLHKRTFQSWQELEEGFKLIGISGISGTLQDAYKVANIKPIKSQLNKIAQSRNRIVHEADLVKHKRGGKPRLNPRSVGEVREAIDFLNDLVAKLETVQ